MANLRFGITGSGFMGRTHAEALRRVADVQLIAVAGGRRAQALAGDYGAACETSISRLLRRTDLDAVIITTPHHLHADEAVQALEQGMHVLVEKPMATSLADCDRMLAAAARAGRTLAVGYHQRFRINNRQARDTIRATAIGALQTAQISMPTYASNIKGGGFGGDWAWWNDPASLGHVLNSAPHAIDLLRWFSGAQVSNITALCRTLLPDVPVEDTTLALLELSNGAICSFFSSRALAAPSFPGEDFRIRITGSTGLLDLDPYKELRLSDAIGWRTLSSQPVVGHEGANTAFGDVRMQAYSDQVQAFVRAIHGQPSDIGNGDDGRAGVAACLAMLTASVERRWVTL